MEHGEVDDLSRSHFPQLRDEYIIAFLHKDALRDPVASSQGFKYEGKASWNLMQRMKDEREDL